MMTAARPMTMAPRPMLISAKPWYWAEQRSGKCNKTIGEHQTEDSAKSVLIPCARAIFSLHPVARREHPSSVPKNQYRTAIKIRRITAATIRIVF